MKNSKKLFLALAAVFLVAMILIGYDISRRTTFPGSKPQLKERLLKQGEKTDSTKNNSKDSTQLEP